MSKDGIGRKTIEIKPLKLNKKTLGTIFKFDEDN